MGTWGELEQDFIAQGGESGVLKWQGSGLTLTETPVEKHLA
jgi:hypothetical protein